MKVLNDFLNDETTLLTKNDLKTIHGGGSYSCYCGFVNDPQSGTFTVKANDIYGALDSAGNQCGGLGATCSGGIQ